MKASLFLIPILLLAGCMKTTSSSSLSSVQLIDRNGFTETITANDRLNALDHTNYLQPQSYQKVTRTYKKNELGKTPGYVTTYHPNGQLWQYLETSDGRAFGSYREYFLSGQIRLDAQIIEGHGDIDTNSQESWLFDKKSYAWNEEGQLIAEIAYQKGYLDGLAIYYGPDGAIQRTVSYKRGLLHGMTSVYNDAKELIGFENFLEGAPHGITQYQGDHQTPAYREHYDDGKLMEATYFDLNGLCIAEIRNGCGKKALFEKGALKQRITYQSGVVEGKVEVFHPHGFVASEFELIDGKKHGEEWFYFPPQEDETKLRPKMCISWYEDAIHGFVKTWYDDGTLENEREMCQNKRHGHNFAWYRDGSLMLMEDYESGLLKRGSYMKKGMKEPVSSVSDGLGTATLHDGSGFFLKSITYQKGRPVE